MPIEMLEAGVADVPEDQEPRRRGSARRWVAVLVLAAIVAALGTAAWDVVRGAGRQDHQVPVGSEDDQ